MKNITAITLLFSAMLLLTACYSPDKQTVNTESLIESTDKQNENADKTITHSEKETDNTEKQTKKAENTMSANETTEPSTPETVNVSIRSKNYYMETKEDADGFTPCLSVFDDGTFGFTYDVLSSYLANGTYTIEDQQLILKTDDGKYQYIFEIEDDDTLLFVKDKSSDVSLIQKDIGVAITDGARFIIND